MLVEGPRNIAEKTFLQCFATDLAEAGYDFQKLGSKQTVGPECIP